MLKNGKISNLIMALPLILLFLTGVYIAPANAYTATLFTGHPWYVVNDVSGWYVRGNSPGYNRVVVNVGTGRIAVPDVQLSDVHVHVMVFDDAGTLLADTDTGFHPHGPISACDFDDDEILFCFPIDGDTIRWLRYNVNSFTVGTSYDSSFSGMSGATTITDVSNIIYANTTAKWYVLAGCYGYLGGSGINTFWFDGSSIGSGTKYTSDGNGGSNSISHGYITDDGEDIYFFKAMSGTFYCYYYDVSGGTLTDIATAPFAGGMPSTDEVRYGYGNYFNFYEINVHETGTYYYLYGAWSKSSRAGSWGGSGLPGERNVSTYFWYIKFNNTISSATILQNTWITDTVIDYSASPSMTLGVSTGYVFHSEASETFDINTYFQNLYGGKKVARMTYTITDISADPVAFSAEAQLNGVDDLDWDYIDFDACVSFSPVYGWTYNAVSTSASYLSVGGTILSNTYSFTYSIAPVDNPMVQNKPYTFTWTLYLNGALDPSNYTYRVSIDSIERDVGYLASGVIVETYSFSTVKTYSLIVSIYDGAVLKTTSNAYLVNIVATPGGGGTVPTVDDLVPQYSYLLTGYAPVAFIVMGPILILGMLGSRMGGAGAVVGMIIGAITGFAGGTQLGLIPTYWLYLLAMAVIGGLILFMRSGGGGGGGE